jgi:hypothetical protein
MAGISPYGAAAMLNYSLAGGAPTIASWAVGLATGGPPTTASASEIATGLGANRAAVTFGAAASPAGSASNNNTLSYGPMSSGATVSGIQVWNTNAAAGGSYLWFGTLSVARTLNVGDSLLINPGSLVITLS